jgi:hypothetical protein
MVSVAGVAQYCNTRHSLIAGYLFIRSPSSIRLFSTLTTGYSSSPNPKGFLQGHEMVGSDGVGIASFQEVSRCFYLSNRDIDISSFTILV